MKRFSAVTFDLWNTLIVEGPCGLLRPRAELWLEVLAADDHGPLDLDDVERAHAAALTAYHAAWVRNEQFCSDEATTAVCEHLGIVPTERLRRDLVRSFHGAGLASDLHLVPGALDVLVALKEVGIGTAIICDIGLTPSSALTQHLRTFGVLEHVDVLAWSDEFGVYKPDPTIFAWTLDQLQVDASRSCHVGDRLRTDVAGARASGMSTARFTGVYDDADDMPEADYVIGSLTELLPLIG